MANYSNLKAAIADVIKTNGTKAITGQVLQDVLNSIVSVIGANYQFAGVATPSTNPGTPDQNVLYFATETGLYPNFGGVNLERRSLYLLMWNGSWHVDDSLDFGDIYDEYIQQFINLLEQYQPIVIEGNVVNAPDEEDLTSVNNLLKFKNKAYFPENFSGLGRVFLRKNIVNGANVLTQAMMSESNTIYIIQYDYTLSENITIPANCILEFAGGSVSGNYQITFTNTILAGKPNIRVNGLSGKILNSEVFVSWFKDVGNDIASVMQFLVNYPRTIVIDEGLWYLGASTRLTTSNVIIKGAGVGLTIIKATDAFAQTNMWMFATNFEDYWNANINKTLDDIDIQIEGVRISDITFNTNLGPFVDRYLDDDTMSYVVFLKNAQDCTIERCEFIDSMTHDKNCFDHAVTCVLCKNIKVQNCRSYKRAFAAMYVSENCCVMFNDGEDSVTTWIETANGLGHKIIGNHVRNQYALTSFVGINCKGCEVSDNVIEQSVDNTYTINSGLTIGHATDENDGRYSYIHHNKIVCNNVSSAALVIQGQSKAGAELNLIIENNIIELNMDNPGSGSSAKLAVGGSGYSNARFCNNKIKSTGRGVFFAGGIVSYNDIEADIYIALTVGMGKVMPQMIKNNIITLNDDSADSYAIAAQFGSPIECCNNFIKGRIKVGSSLDGRSINISNNTIDVSHITGTAISVTSNYYPEISNNIIKATTLNWFIYIWVPTSVLVTDAEKYEIIPKIKGNITSGTTTNCYALLTDNNTSRTINKVAVEDYDDRSNPGTSGSIKGKMLFDKTLGKPIWWNGSNWVDATGTPV